MVAMFTKMLFNQFWEFSGYVRFGITAELWTKPCHVDRLISPWLPFLIFVLLELGFLLISTGFLSAGFWNICLFDELVDIRLEMAIRITLE